jgi:hypothetical protein
MENTQEYYDCSEMVLAPDLYCLAIDSAGRYVDCCPTKYPVSCPCLAGRKKQVIENKRKFIDHLKRTIHMTWVASRNNEKLPPSLEQLVQEYQAENKTLREENRQLKEMNARLSNEKTCIQNHLDDLRVIAALHKKVLLSRALDID